MEMVVDKNIGQSQEGLVTCREMVEHFPSVRSYTDDTHPITSPYSCVALGRVKPELVGIPGKALTRDAMRRVQFDVNAAGWLHAAVVVSIAKPHHTASSHIADVTAADCCVWFACQGEGDSQRRQHSAHTILG